MKWVPLFLLLAAVAGCGGPSKVDTAALVAEIDLAAMSAANLIELTSPATSVWLFERFRKDSARDIRILSKQRMLMDRAAREYTSKGEMDAAVQEYYLAASALCDLAENPSGTLAEYRIRSLAAMDRYAEAKRKLHL